MAYSGLCFKFDPLSYSKRVLYLYGIYVKYFSCLSPIPKLSHYIWRYCRTSRGLVFAKLWKRDTQFVLMMSTFLTCDWQQAAQLLVLSFSAPVQCSLRTTLCRSPWEGPPAEGYHSPHCCQRCADQATLGNHCVFTLDQSLSEVHSFDLVFICCQEPGCKLSLYSSALGKQKQYYRSLVHSKCYMPGLFFRKLYLFFFYKSTTGTKVKE